MDQDETRHGCRPRPRPHCVRWGSISPPQKGHSPQLLAHVCCGQTAGWIKTPLGREVDLGPGDIVLDGDPAPLSPKGHSHPLLAHVCCGQTAGWMKLPLGVEVGLGPDDIVLDADPAPPKKRTAPHFSTMSSVAKLLDGSRCISGEFSCMGWGK